MTLPPTFVHHCPVEATGGPAGFRGPRCRRARVSRRPRSACSRSPLIPAETQVAVGADGAHLGGHGGQPRERRRGVPAERRDPHDAAQPRPSAAATSPASRRASSGATPLRPPAGRAASRLTWTSTSSARSRSWAARDSPRSSRARSTDCTTSAQPPTAAALLLCSPPMKCHVRSRSRHSSCLAIASWCRFSPTCAHAEVVQDAVRRTRGRTSSPRPASPRRGPRPAVGAGGRRSAAYDGEARRRPRRGARVAHRGPPGGSRRGRPGGRRPARRGGRSRGRCPRRVQRADVDDARPRRLAAGRGPRRPRSTDGVPHEVSAQDSGTTAATSSRIVPGTS